MSLKAKTAKDLIFVKSQKLRGLKVLNVVLNLRSRTVDSDLRGKQGYAEKISGFHELKGQYGGFFYSCLRFLRAKTAQITIRTVPRPYPI